MRLFIAEKPSVGREISKYLSGKGKICDGYIDHGEDVVTWAFGHILQQAEPEDYADKYAKWNIQDLPIIPEKWKLNISKSSAKQFQIIKKLLERADLVVHAGDPDREGQLLIDEILVYLDYPKPVQRILINALDEKSMREALKDLRNNAEFFNLRQSALARSRADWLIGMNLSRAYTLAARKQGHKVTFPIGRVKTPTLSLVVRREEELNSFKAVEYYTIKALYKHNNGEFWASWKPQDTQKGLDEAERLIDKNIAEEMVQKLSVSPKAKILQQEKKHKKEAQRLPLSLSSLQVMAGKAYGYDPQTVLDIAQKLYEKKFTTYPRSDCEYLPESQLKDGKFIIANLQKNSDLEISNWSKGANIKIKSKAWNDKKITAHHAIIPTTVFCDFGKITTAEQNIYKLIAQAYLAQFYPVHEYEQTKITVEHSEELFIANGRVIKINGWKDLFSKKNKTEDSKLDNADDNGEFEDASLPSVKKGDGVEALNFQIKDQMTKPPTRFTAATLLQAMKEIYKYVKNDDLKKQLKDVAGIGTEATRASIIDDLIKRGFIEESGKKKILKPTENAYLLVHNMPEEISYPDETAIWEERLAKMSEGKDSLDSFLNDQVLFLKKLVGSAIGEKNSTHQYQGQKKCPQCEGILMRRKGKYGDFWGCNQYPKCTYTEKVELNNNSSITIKDDEKKYKCPRCADGYFIRRENMARGNWFCSNVGNCRTQCGDVNNMPSIYYHQLKK